MLARGRVVFAQELSHTLRRPLFWFLVFLLLLMSWGMSIGKLQIASGDASVGGTKAWLTSEFSVAFFLLALVTLLYSFFLSIASGLAVIRDDDARLSELQHSTSLRPGEYVWGKFLGIFVGFLVALVLHLFFTILFNHVIPNPQAAEIRGPFDLVNYLRPAVVFALPALTFFAGISFFLGERWRRPMTVFLFPVAVLLAVGFFLWDWSPTWLDPRINRSLMLVDPGGFRWLNETWIKLDRGARFYNTARIGLDLPFVLSRLGFFGIGLLGVALAQRHLTKSLRGTAREPKRLRKRRQVAAALEAGDFVALPQSPRPLSALGMHVRPGGFLEGLFRVARSETRNLLSTPAIYVFAVLILLQVLGNSLIAVGAFGTRILLTPGLLAVNLMGEMTFLLCLLLMFYTAESLERERSTGLASLAYSAPIPTPSILFGKALANSLVGASVLLAAFGGCVIALLVQGNVAPNPIPFLMIWGPLLFPTFLVWTAFVTCLQSVFGNRFVTYGVALGVLALTLYRQLTGDMSWVGNWPVWGAVRWTDMGPLELDRKALVLNRVFALGLAVFFTAVAVRAFNRRQADAIGTLHRLQGPAAARRLLRLTPFAILPLVAGVLLWVAVLDGPQGGNAEKKARDYWKQNLATWKDAPRPALAGVDLDLRLDPERHSFRTRGTYELLNDREMALARFALTGGLHWKDVRWTLSGRPYQPEDRSGLYVFSANPPLRPGGKLRVGFEMSGRVPDGISKNGGGMPEFILPSGVVLTSFRPTFIPTLGYDEERGIKKDENDYEPRVYPDDFYRGKTDSLFGFNRSFRTRIRITGPADFTWNSVGTLVSDGVRDGLRTAVWESDHPIRFFNVVGGRWKERKGNGTAIFYHPGHEYNIAEMSATFDASRRWYSEWFHPFPWRELKLSEFPNLDSYAQGFPTNITFSEGIGFLTKSDEKTDAVFVVTAHETAHQWWGNLVTPGKGPGGNILSEGTSHFSTLLLMEQVKGPRERMELAKRLEERYGENRRADAERALVWIDNSREGDTTVTYDKGGWVFWMLMRHMGRERALAGIRQFFHEWSDNPDHPVLQDFLATMRPFAPDTTAFDAFVRQWFHEVVLPEFELSRARKTRTGRQWRVTVDLRNAGTGRMPVEVAAVRGERFAEDGKPGKDYRDVRATVTLKAGGQQTVVLLCPFDPERVVVDPDVQVLQLRRNGAVAKL